MRYEPSSPLRYSTLRGGTCVVEGYGVRVYVRHSRLHVSDGFGRNRRERVYSRMNPGVARLVVLGFAGSVTLEAIRWLADLGIGFAHIDMDGRLLLTSTPGSENARLRRAQALATLNTTGAEIARSLLRDKLAGQRKVLRRLTDAPDVQAEFERASAWLETADTVNEMVMAERDAALAYWSAWASVAIRFRRSDLARLPEYWALFGTRGSPLSGGPRVAINPANALLNYAYAILEAETRIACHVVGLDPSIPIVHGDRHNAFVFDLMEPVRPEVDAYVLDLLQERTFKASDFYETRRGNCRLVAPMTHTLAETAPTWGQLVAPIVEQVARILAESSEHVVKVPTPLTSANRSTARDAVRRASRHAAPKRPRPPRDGTCRRCEREVPEGRVVCDTCLPAVQEEQHANFAAAGPKALARLTAEGRDPRHEGESARKRASANSRHKRAAAAWDREHGRADPAEFGREILPAIQEIPLRRLMAATGLSLRHVQLIRRGERVPHPRHWDAFRAAGAADVRKEDRPRLVARFDAGDQLRSRNVERTRNSE